VPLFVLLNGMMCKLGCRFNKTLFIFGNSFRRSWQRECKLANFLLGQAKLAILKSSQCNVMLIKSLVKSLVVTEYTYYQQPKKMLFYLKKYGVLKKQLLLVMNLVVWFITKHLFYLFCFVICVNFVLFCRLSFVVFSVQIEGKLKKCESY